MAQDLSQMGEQTWDLLFHSIVVW